MMEVKQRAKPTAKIEKQKLFCVLIFVFVIYHHILTPNEGCEVNGCVFEDTLLETMSDVLSNILIPCSAF